MKRQNEPCCCGSGLTSASCCGPLLAGDTQALTAEQLMRSRYTAYATGHQAYLQRTWHPSTRPAIMQIDAPAQPRWEKLSVLASTGGSAQDSEGTVEFIAHYTLNGNTGRLHETSRFVRENGKWYYLDGDSGTNSSANSAKIGRNAPCPCGSGKKYKRCCAQSVT